MNVAVIIVVFSLVFNVGAFALACFSCHISAAEHRKLTAGYRVLLETYLQLLEKYGDQYSDNHCR